jgi:hypothetical protein
MSLSPMPPRFPSRALHFAKLTRCFRLFRSIRAHATFWRMEKTCYSLDGDQAETRGEPLSSRVVRL